MFLASGRVGVVRMSVLREPNILCTEFLDVAGVESWCDERERLYIASAASYDVTDALDVDGVGR